MREQLSQIVGTIKFKVIAILVITGMFFLLLFSTFYLLATRALTNRIVDSYEHLMSLYISQVESNIYNIESYIFTLSQDFDVNALAITDPNSDEYMLTKFKIHKQLLSLRATYNLLDGICIYDKRNDDFLVVPDDFSRYHELASALSYATDPPLDTNWHLFEHHGIHSLVKYKEVSDTLSIFFYIKVDDIVDMYGNAGNGATDIWVLSPDGKPIASILSSSGPAELNTGLRGYTYIERKLEQFDLNFLLAIDNRDIWSELSLYTSFFAVALVIMATIVLVSYKKFKRAFLSPLNTLVQGMDRFAKGDENISLPQSGSTEMMFAIDTFNGMVYQIKNNRILIYEERLEKQKLMIQNLQAQIDPHFFSNTMNLLYNLVAMKEFEATKKCLLNLSEYYRHITRIAKESITLKEEFEFLRSYLEIMSMRFGQYLTYCLDIATELSELPIPPLILQPLVENSIQHGFLDRQQPFHIDVKAYIDGNSIVMQIADTGIGFPKGYLGTYSKARPLNIPGNGKHIGVSNVLQRLIMQYENDVDFTIARTVDGHTEITIQIHASSPGIEDSK